jgi:anti-sigma regulatory factor (Ser/Thr protein kinase)
MTKDMEQLTLPAQIEYLETLRAFVRRGADATDLTPEEADKLDLVLEELFVNIARHAYTPEQGHVEVGYAVEAPGRLFVEISDTGRAFNPLSSGMPDFSVGLAERPLGGMGIFLARAITHSIRYERDGNRNTISFVFLGERCAQGS